MIDLLRKTVIMLGGEQLSAEIHWKGGSGKGGLEGPVDLMICEVTKEFGISDLKRLRERFPHAHLLILQDHKEEPGQYIRPDIIPSGLLKKPVSPDQAHLLFDKIIRNIYEERERGDPRSRLKIRSGMEWYYIPYSSILYLEARDKCILLHYDKGVICFRDTIKNLEKKLPDYFSRCHRGIIVNFLHVRNINMDQGSICLDNSARIPLSRSFRACLERKITDI